MQTKLKLIVLAISATISSSIMAQTDIVNSGSEENIIKNVNTIEPFKDFYSEIDSIELRIINGVTEKQKLNTETKQNNINVDVKDINKENNIDIVAEDKVVTKETKDVDKSIIDNIKEGIVLKAMEIKNAIKADDDIDHTAKLEELSRVNQSVSRDNVVHISDLEKDAMRAEILKQNGISEHNDSELIFLNNLPVGTKLTFNSDYIVLPKADSIIIQDGVTLLNTPDLLEAPTSYCTIDLKKSGRARVIKAGREFILVKNASDVKKVSNNSFINGPLKIQKQIMWVDNEHIKNITCNSSSYVSDNKLPIMIYDLYKQTGGNITVSFPAFEEI